jgi:hypothetical protein
MKCRSNAANVIKICHRKKLFNLLNLFVMMSRMIACREPMLPGFFTILVQLPCIIDVRIFTKLKIFVIVP